MDKLFTLAVVLMVSIWVFFLATIFQYSLPMWCDNPKGNGNWIVQPMCK